MLDAEMLARHGVSIAPPGTPDASLPSKSGRRVAWELGVRYLLKYVFDWQIDVITKGTEKKQYVTPTPYSPEDVMTWLALPAPNQPRKYVLVLKAEAVRDIKGRRWIRFGGGIEFILPAGFSADAIADVGTSPGTQWPLLVS